MSPNIALQVANMERELLALSADQPPNPNQITTFKVIRTTTSDDEIRTIAFEAGAPRFIQLFQEFGNASAYIYLDGIQLKVRAQGLAGITYTLVSLGAFTLV